MNRDSISGYALVLGGLTISTKKIWLMIKEVEERKVYKGDYNGFLRLSAGYNGERNEFMMLSMGHSGEISRHPRVIVEEVIDAFGKA